MQAVFISPSNAHSHGATKARSMLNLRRGIAFYQKSCHVIWKSRYRSDFNRNYSQFPCGVIRSRIRLASTGHFGFVRPLILVHSRASHGAYQNAQGIHSSSTAEENRSKECEPVEKQQLSALDLLPDFIRADESRLNDLMRKMFPFQMDQYQRDALDALGAGRSVVVSAPTGAGKTVVGEIAVYLALCRQMRIFYTTPLKALSNQKYYDFKKLFGDNKVGLLTGDQTINREGDVLIMTTEVYRNMLYADSTEIQQGPSATQNLFAVVFDEFHYLNDKDRGTVWEESVINSPPGVLLVALSATMSNTGDVRDWFAAVQGPTELISSDIRPVPLSFSYFDSDGIMPLFEDTRGKRSQRKRGGRGFGRYAVTGSGKGRNREAKLHPKLLRKLRETQRANDTKDRRKKTVTTGEVDTKRATASKFKEVLRGQDKRRDRFKMVPSIPFVVRGLQKRDMLPCIVFIFSRVGCDRAARTASCEHNSLVSPEERREIKARLDELAENRPGMVQKERLDLALRGIASHHAGLLPVWKMCVEEMFQDGLIKVIFATETLAAGINMPARTTVISSLSKRVGDDGFASLTTSEILQMAGRAGRRGKDTQGYSVILKSRNEGPVEAFKLLTSPVDALESKFSPSYGMVLNLLSARPIAAVKTLVDRSFGNFLRRKEVESEIVRLDTTNTESGSSDVDKIQRERNALEAVLREAKDILASSDEKLLRSYIKGIERVKAERRALMYLMKQGEVMNAELVEETLTFAPTGTKMLLREQGTSRSTGQERRQRRREYSSAIVAAANGDLGQELKSFYLESQDPELELLNANEGDNGTQEVEAVLLDMHTESTGIPPMFAAVDADGNLRLFNHTAVSQLLYDSDPIDVDTYAPGWREVPLPDRSEWKSVGSQQYLAPLPDCLQSVVNHMQNWRKMRHDSGSNADGATYKSRARLADSHGPEIEAQLQRLEHAKQFVLDHKLHRKGDTAALLAAKRAISKIEATLDGRYDPFGNKKRQGRSETYKRYLNNRTTTKDGIRKVSASNSSWDEFMSLVSVLQHYGFIDENCNVTSLGALGAKVRSENELWSSLVLMDPSLERVSPVSLGAVLGSTLMETARSDTYVSQEVSEEVKRSLTQAAQERARLFAIQSEHAVEIPIGLDAELMGLVELWASGVSWVELLSNTSLQEGHACRMLRRVLDILRQIQHLPVVGSGLKRNAKRAIALLDRFPVTDDLTYTIHRSEMVGDDDYSDNEQNTERSSNNTT